MSVKKGQHAEGVASAPSKALACRVTLSSECYHRHGRDVCGALQVSESAAHIPDGAQRIAGVLQFLQREYDMVFNLLMENHQDLHIGESCGMWHSSMRSRRLRAICRLASIVSAQSRGAFIPLIQSSWIFQGSAQCPRLVCGLLPAIANSTACLPILGATSYLDALSACCLWQPLLPATQNLKRCAQVRSCCQPQETAGSWMPEQRRWTFT